MFNSTHLHAALRRMSCGFLPLLIVMAGFTATADAQVRPDAQDYVVHEAGGGGFPIASSGTPAPIFADDAGHPGVLRAAADLQGDIERVIRRPPSLHPAVHTPSDVGHTISHVSP